MKRRILLLPPAQSTTYADRRGLALLEMALLFPLLFLIVIGCVDFGRFAHSYIAVTNAARTAAEFGAKHPYTPGTQAIWQASLNERCQDELQQTLSVSGLTASDVTVSATRIFENGSPDSLWRVECTVSMPFNMMVGLPGMPSSLNLNRTAEFRGIR